MRHPALILLAVLLASGCATNSIARRKQERLDAYSNLPASHQVAVEQGRLLEGMTTNAVYIAWGKPSETSSEGTTIKWLYHEKEYEEQKHTTIAVGPRVYGIPEETRTLYSRSVLRKSVTFDQGLVREWTWTPPRQSQDFR